MSAQGLHHYIEADVRLEVVGVLYPFDVGPHPLVDVGVLKHHPHDGKLEARRGLDVHAVETERPVSLYADYPLLREGHLGGDGEGHAGTDATGHPGVKPVPGIVHRDHLPGDVHGAGAIGHYDCVLGHEVAYLLQYAVVAHGVVVAVEHGLDRLGVSRGLLLELRQPIALTKGHGIVFQGVDELAHHHLCVAHQSHGGRHIVAYLTGLNVNLHQFEVWREPGWLAEVEEPVETRANHQDGVGALEGLGPGCRDVHRVVGRQHPRAHGRGQEGDPCAVHELEQLIFGHGPTGAFANDQERPLGFFQYLQCLCNLLRFSQGAGRFGRRRRDGHMLLVHAA